MKSACLYVRVSTDLQLELSPDSQKQLLLDYCKKNDYVVTDNDIYEDLGISGRKADKRPAFNQMIAMCKSKEHPYDAIIVWKFSRFARNQEESVVYKRMLKKVGVDVISISEPISDDIGGRIAESIFEIMDEYYSINLSQEVTRGMTENAKRGNYQCRTPYGYRRISKGQYEIVPEEAEVVKYIYQQYIEKDCLMALTKELNDKGIKSRTGRKWERKVVTYILENPFYCGKIRWNYKDHKNTAQPIKDESEWIITEGHHEPIVSVEEWEIANKRMKSRKIATDRKRAVVGTKHWLSGILRCSECGSVLTYHSSKISNDAFACNGYSKGRCSCSNRTTVPKLEKYFFEGMKYIIDNDKFNFADAKKPKAELDMYSLLEKELSDIERKEQRIKQAYRDGIDTLEEYKENKTIILSEKEKVLLKMENIASQSNKEINQEDRKLQFFDMLDLLQKDTFTTAEKNELLKQHIEKIVYSREKQTMDFSFYRQ